MGPSTGSNLTLKNSAMKANYLLLVICLFWLNLPARAQQWELVRTFPVEAPTAVSADLQGTLYTATAGGEIKSYSPEGALLQTYSPRSASYFTSLEARSGMQLWAFDENRQQLLFLDRFLNPVSSKQLPPDVFGFASAVSPAAGNSLWVVDASDMQLKQWRTDTRQLLSRFRLNLLRKAPSEIKALKEYQHKLYLFSPEALYVFDNLGAFERSIPLVEWLSFSFAEDTLLLLTADNLLRIPLYTGTENTLPLPGGQGYTRLLYSKGAFYFFTEEEVQVYRLLP